MAARFNQKDVNPNNFEMAVERIIGGMEMKKKVDETERRTVAYHESGHGVVAWFLEGGAPLLKVQISNIFQKLTPTLAHNYPKKQGSLRVRPVPSK